jgi:UDP-3-O-[3-hydroxymyristoyl] glucosamine N-acyltransferase
MPTFWPPDLKRRLALLFILGSPRQTTVPLASCPRSPPSFMQPPVSLDQLAQSIPASRVQGDGSVLVERFLAPNEIESPTDLPLVSSPWVADALLAAPQLPIKAAVVSEEAAERLPALLERLAGILVVKRPRFALVALTQIFSSPAYAEIGIHESAVVHESAQVDPSASIGPHVTIGPRVIIGSNTRVLANASIRENAVVGADCLLHPGVRIGPRVRLGDRVIIKPNACIGSDGFSFATEETSQFEFFRTGKGIDKTSEVLRQERIGSNGTVVIEDDVEIGACSTVDLATLGECRIKRGTKVDNLVHIAHNATIGEDCLICAQVGVAGSCKIGDGVVLAGQVGVGDHLTIGDRSIMLGGAEVTRSVEEAAIYYGAPAQPYRDAMRTHASLRRLGEMRKELRELRKLKDTVAQLSARLDELGG